MSKTTRRDNHEGSIFYSETENRWIASIQYGVDNNGKPLVKRFTSTKENGKKIVRDKLNEFKQKNMLGKVGSNSGSMPLNKYILMWLDTFQKINVKQSTFVRDKNIFRCHIKETIGYLKINEITPLHIQKLLNYKAESLSSSSVEKIYSLLNRVFTKAVKLGDLKINPCKAVTFPKRCKDKYKQIELKIYTLEETQKMKEAIFDSYNEGRKLYRTSPSYILLLNTGMRVGELLALTWDNVDFDNNMLKVVATQETICSEHVYKRINTTPKTKSSYRTIPLNETAIEMLRELQRRNEVEGIKTEYVVSNVNGGSVSDNNYRRSFRRFCKRYNITYKGVHAFRHTYATRLFDNDIDVQLVSKVLGHNNTQITRDIYIHVLDEHIVKTIGSIKDI